MKLAITLAVSVFYSFTSFGQASKIINNSKYEGVVFSTKTEIWIGEPVRRWDPSEKDIQVLEDNLETFLSNKSKQQPNNKNLLFVCSHLKEYIRQYAGYMSANGERMIYVNALSKQFTKLFDWRKGMIETSDGGKYYWQIYYNLKKKTFKKFGINGNA